MQPNATPCERKIPCLIVAGCVAKGGRVQRNRPTCPRETVSF